VVFAGEAQFIGERMQNFHNQLLLADASLPSHYQQRFSINIWANVCGGNYSDPMYFKTGKQTGLSGVSWKRPCLFPWPTRHSSLVENCTSFMTALLQISVSLPAGT
jgi:hypothetical protein